jgi:putative membrane protein
MANPVSDSLSKLPDATALAVERTRLAHERTLMAWVRTSVSLISFGFTIYKFFQYQGEHGGGALNPRRFGMSMILVGLFALVLSTIQHRRDLRLLDARFGKGERSLAGIVAILVGAVGILALVGAFLRQ